MTANLQPANVGSVPIRIAEGSKPQLSFRGLSVSRMVLVEIKYGTEQLLQTAPLPSWENAYTVGVRFRAESSEVSVNGKVAAMSAKAGDTRFVYLPDVDYVDFNSPRHSLEMLLPRKFLNDLTDDLECGEITRIGNSQYQMAHDPLLYRMSRAVLPYMDQPEMLDPLFADHFMWSFATYVCSKYGDLKGRRTLVGGLSTVQTRLVQEMIRANLHTRISLTELAQACGLRTSQFAHAFKRSMGVAPYTWALRERVSMAKRLMASKEQFTLAQVAHLCGFADQSHLTRVFSRMIGATPAAWRACHLKQRL